MSVKGWGHLRNGRNPSLGFSLASLKKQDYHLLFASTRAFRVQTHIEISEECSMCLDKNSGYLVMADTKVAGNEGRFARVGLSVAFRDK